MIPLLSTYRSFTGTMSSLTDGGKKWQTKLSSAGLVYLHFGHRVISQLLGNNQSVDSNTINVIYDKVMWYVSNTVKRLLQMLSTETSNEDLYCNKV